VSESPTTPIPIPTQGAEAPRLLVMFGGTFDPPHRGHVELPKKVRDELERRAGCVGNGWLVYVPAARSPHKSKGPQATDADRVEMLKRAIEGVARTCVWTDEIDRAGSQEAEGGGASFTVDTLTRARDWLVGACGEHAPAIRLLIGADQAIGFDKWRAPREIIRLAPPVVMVRGDVEDADELLRRIGQTGFWKSLERELWREAMVPVGRIDVSATAVRERLSQQDWEGARRWLAPEVIDLIRERGLYQRPA
jgi:nicotinate-nucleotide adenylyltransferase